MEEEKDSCYIDSNKNSRAELSGESLSAQKIWRERSHLQKKNRDQPEVSNEILSLMPSDLIAFHKSFAVYSNGIHQKLIHPPTCSYSHNHGRTHITRTDTYRDIVNIQYVMHN